MNLPNGYLIYRGPSLLNGAPIVAVVIAKSSNPKTGDMSQAYILPDNEDGPVAAIRNGADESVCGDCQHRPRHAGTCYVVVRQGAMRVWKSFRQGRYADLSRYLDIAAEILSDRMMRLGAYGDPAAVPVDVWREVTARLPGWVGYTHQWRRVEALPLRPFCMASVDSESEMRLAQINGWRTFRVRTLDEPVAKLESVCPASEEAGHKLTCDRCRSCDGGHRELRGNITIALHGNHMKDRTQRFIEIRERRAA